MYQVNSKTGAINLDHQDQIGLQTFYKKTVSHYTLNLNCALIIYWFNAQWGILGAGGGDKDACLFANAKKALTTFSTF